MAVRGKSGTIKYAPAGVCSRKMTLTLKDGVVVKAAIEGGCAGNTQGLGRLVVGLRAEEIVKRLRGIDCAGKGTSCPDQLARAVEQWMKRKRSVSRGS